MTSQAPAPPPSYILYIRSVAYLLFQVLTVLLYATLGVLVAAVLPFRYRYRLLRTWAEINIWFLARVCRLDYQVEGLENRPSRPSIVMANHQSAWETLAFQHFFPPMAWVLKRELLWIPFFGWGLALIEPIAIDRKAGRRSLERMIEVGRQRLRAGRWVMIFPQGTRLPPGEVGRFKVGGAMLAVATDAPVVPVVHNSGRYWGRRRLLKYPGTIRVIIGPPIETGGRDAQEVLTEVRTWIEEHMRRIGA